ncbi:O-antigen ligase [Notoacmeibacter sp. MSK16QG-6]|uniref:O-antigen ligase family protein n=1 Tax=Notoacmeibacter sp. MSK16QG-6 TaxID=2957982 RepID=UPI0020A0DE1F|nr:O-antigen ligase family protein [Notoacmeibacter sp. MSK16QG-6]MCP1198445.1 O-antigen ligase family protein [Notoacmeibacter sp. MSK16QG-6]
MSAATGSTIDGPSAEREALPISRLAVQRHLLGLVAKAAIGLAVLLAGFVKFEPAPYEIYMAALIPIWALFGLRLATSITPLIVLLVTFNIGGLLSMLVMDKLYDTPLYLAVSLFLALSAIFYAAVIRQRPDVLQTIMVAWAAAGVVTSLLGIAGFFGVPGLDLFTRYGRATGVFEDPNVFGPFLVPPSLYLLHRVVTGPVGAMAFRALPLVIIVLGIFFSFSRGAWGLLLFSAIVQLGLLLLHHRSARFRIRILILGLAGLALLGVSIAVALQIPAVAELFSSRAQLVQDYDGGHMGRFDRHIYGFKLAMEYPLGIGPLNFGRMLGEDTHNIWLKALMDYGWLGFASWLLMIVWSLVGGFRIMFRQRIWQPFLLVSWVALFGHTLLGFIIDTDHWRHFYLLLGMVWGCIALESRFHAGTLDAEGRRIGRPPPPAWSRAVTDTQAAGRPV